MPVLPLILPIIRVLNQMHRILGFFGSNLHRFRVSNAELFKYSIFVFVCVQWRWQCVLIDWLDGFSEGVTNSVWQCHGSTSKDFSEQFFFDI